MLASTPSSREVEQLAQVISQARAAWEPYNDDLPQSRHIARAVLAHQAKAKDV